jgi:hypothetical protein
MAYAIGGVRCRMRVEDLMDSKTRVFTTQIAHEGNPAHPGLHAFAGEHGYEVAFDGLVVDVLTTLGAAFLAR